MCAKNLRGQRFGMLTCIEPTDQRGPGGGVVWRCRCDCGGECLAVSTQLTQGFKKSCGCLSHPPVKDLVGRRFGMLVVTAYDGRRDGKHFWRCRCDCGRETVVCQSNLQNGHTKSCGCVQRQIYQENMRLVDGTSVTMIENRMKTPIRSNKSGYNGVYRNKRTGMWTAQITFKGKTYYLGSYPLLQDAVKARQRGEAVYDDFLNWYYNEYLTSKSG